MNQGSNVNNGIQNQNVVSQPQVIPNVQNNIQSTPAIQNTQNNIQPTPVVQNTQAGVVQPTPMPASPQTNVVNPTPMPASPQTNVVNPTPMTNTVTPNTQNVINTSKKRGGHVLLFIAIILIAAFIYYIDDVLAYFNQNFTPVVDGKIPDSGEANLIDGYIKIDDLSAYIKLNSVKFSNVKKNIDNSIVLSYVSDRNYATTNALNINIVIYNSNREQIYIEKFNVAGSIDAEVNRQYKIKLEESKYKDAYYVLVTNKSEGNK